MLELKYSHLRNPNFLRGMSRLANFQGLKDPKALYNIMRVHKKVEQEHKSCHELFMKIIKEYAELDGNGIIVPSEENPQLPKIPPEKQEECKKKIEEMEDISFKVDRYKIKIEDLATAGLTAVELGAMEDILDVSGLDPKPSLSVV